MSNIELYPTFVEYKTDNYVHSKDLWLVDFVRSHEKLEGFRNVES